MRFGIDRRTFVGAAAVVAAVPLARLNASGGNGSENVGSDRLGKYGVSPKDFGAVGDGKTDDLTAVVAAIAYALDNGYPIDGGDLEYAVSGGITISNRSRPYINRLRLKQLNPANDRKTLYFSNCEHIRVDSLNINVGSAANVGSMEHSVGFLVQGGSRHKIKNVTVTGDGKVTYAQFWRCTDSTFEHIQVHDGQFEEVEVDPTYGFLVPDDVVQGIHLADCTTCSLINPVVRNLTGNATYYNTANVIKPYANLRTRGIAGGGNTNCTVLNPKISNVDQAIDFSGNGDGHGNTNVQVIGGHLFNCGSVGVKFANASQGCKAIGTIAENCGMTCFLLSGYDATYKAKDGTFIGCTGRNPGYNDIHNDTDAEPLAHAGFHVRQDSAGGNDGARIIGCKAIDEQGFFLAGDDLENWPQIGATSGTMRYAWTAPSGSYSITFNTGETRTAALTTGLTRVTWSGGLGSTVTDPFVSLPPKMQYGFLNEVGYNAVSGKPNTIESCESVGHIIAAEKGFHRDVCHVTADNLQAAAHNTSVAITFNTEVEDTMEMHSTTSNTDKVYPKRAGKYRVRGLVAFATSSGGYRRLQVRRGATVLYTLPFATVSGEATACQFDCEVEFTAADIAANAYVSIWGKQTSGVTVHLNADRWMIVERLRPS